uniref:Uncharacterized protein n=1 Tax=Arundo donax TaxID=35708 RepID=A0A0A9FRM0_ARUDO
MLNIAIVARTAQVLICRASCRISLESLS